MYAPLTSEGFELVVQLYLVSLVNVVLCIAGGGFYKTWSSVMHLSKSVHWERLLLKRPSLVCQNSPFKSSDLPVLLHQFAIVWNV